MKKKKQNINCDVKDCAYNDKDNLKCNLEEINVTTDSNINTDKKETVCDSFEKGNDEDIEEEYELGKEYYEDVD